MATTREELDRFHRFAADQIGSDQSPFDLEELLMRWMDQEDCSSIGAAVDRGLREMESGLGRPVGEVSEELRRKHGISAP